MRLTSGSRLSAARPGNAAWSAEHGRLVVACSACGHLGLLERESREMLHPKRVARRAATTRRSRIEKRPAAPGLKRDRNSSERPAARS